MGINYKGSIKILLVWIFLITFGIMLLNNSVVLLKGLFSNHNIVQDPFAFGQILGKLLISALVVYFCFKAVKDAKKKHLSVKRYNYECEKCGREFLSEKEAIKHEQKCNARRINKNGKAVKT